MTKKMMRVAVVMPLAHQQGGAEALFLHLLRQRSRRFELVCVFLQEGPLVQEVRDLGYETFVRRTTRLTDPLNYVTTVSWLRDWLKHQKPAAVFSWMLKAHLYVGVAAAGLRLRTLWFQHGISHGGRMDRLATALPADLILCCSIASQDAQRGLSAKRKTAVCYPGVVFPTLNPFGRREAREKLDLDVHANIIGMVARLERWKGVHILVEAARIVGRTLPSTYFFIVGGEHPRDPAYAAYVRQLAADSSLQDRIYFAGQRPATEVPLWQASADIIVHPVTGEEPFGMAVAEAMGMGRVVVASDAGGPREIIHNREDGFLVPRGDAEALAEQLVSLLKDMQQLHPVERKAFERGRSFSVPIFVDRIDELLSEVAGSNIHPLSS